MGKDTGGEGYRWTRVQVGKDIGGQGYRLGKDTGGQGYRWARIQAGKDTGIRQNENGTANRWYRRQRKYVQQTEGQLTDATGVRYVEVHCKKGVLKKI